MTKNNSMQHGKPISKKKIQQMTPEEQDRLYARFFTDGPDDPISLIMDKPKAQNKSSKKNAK